MTLFNFQAPTHRANQKLHDDILWRYVNQLRASGATGIRAELEGHDRPYQIVDHIPDATARVNGRDLIVEAETSDSISIEHTRRQWATFSAAALRSGAVFVIVVPPQSVEDAKRQATAWGVIATVVADFQPQQPALTGLISSHIRRGIR